MPFISKDWRSPGEEWVKTDEGWEKKKILECGHYASCSSIGQNNINQRCSSESTCPGGIECTGVPASGWLEEEDKENLPANRPDDNTTLSAVNGHNKVADSIVQPYCHITLKCTREIAGFNGLSDAFKRLDFRSAVHDVRRFNYVCKLLDLLITQKLTNLSGCAQKVLFNMLEEVAYQVYASKQNIHMLNKLLDDLRLMVDCACWGRPLGSTQLWEQHLQTINRIRNIADCIKIQEPGDDVYPKLQNLPEECIREVLLRLADHKDLESSGKAYNVMQRLIDEERIWRELCRFHFSTQQINFIRSKQENVDWQTTFHKLRKSFGLREEYAEIIQLCRNCRCLFWKSIGHPCIADQDPEFMEKLESVDKTSLHVPIPPQAFLKFFSL